MTPFEDLHRECLELEREIQAREHGRPFVCPDCDALSEGSSHRCALDVDFVAWEIECGWKVEGL